MDDWRDWRPQRVKKWRKLPVCATRADLLSAPGVAMDSSKQKRSPTQGRLMIAQTVLSG